MHRVAVDSREISGVMVGAEGFEPPALCSQSRCATRLRYAPTLLDCTRHPSAFLIIGLSSSPRQARCMSNAKTYPSKTIGKAKTANRHPARTRRKAQSRQACRFGSATNRDSNA
jgi:hypothetical protein